MTTTANLVISELDFDAIKNNLITYLSGQSEFTDYNFTGSGLSVLLDVLAYNTHYSGYYVNMLINEMFLDSAIKRGSVVSRAKELGYNFKTSHASTAIVNILVDPGLDTPTTIVLPRGTIFRTVTPLGVAMNFVTTDSAITHQVAGQYQFSNISLKEGEIVQNAFVYDSVNNPRSLFEIPNADVDGDTLRVYVRNSINDLNEDLYILANNAYGLSGKSKIYFLQENFLGNFELQFGDDILGKALHNGNVVRIEYVVSHKSSADGCASFLLDNFNGYQTLVQTLSASSGGVEKESTDKIRMLAPKVWATQNRIVTAKDYYTWAMNNIPAVESVSAWGGEDNIPPYYGKVFISIKPLNGYTYNEAEKEALVKNYFKDNSVVTVTPVIVDPSYLFITVNTEIKYNPDLLTISPDALKVLCSNTINNWFDVEMQKFGVDFFYSKFVRMIDDIDPSIYSNQTTIKLQRRVPVINNQSIAMTMDFQNPIVPTTLTCNYFQILYNNNYYTVYTKDVLTNVLLNTGTVSLLNMVDGSTVIDNAGTIYYSTGVVVLNVVKVSQSYDLNSQIRFNAESSSYDVMVTRNNILTLDDSGFDYTKNQSYGLVVTLTATRV
jgi:hypothetical protein